MSPQEPFLSQLRPKILTTFSSTMDQASATLQRLSISNAHTLHMTIIVFSWEPYFLVLRSRTSTMPSAQARESLSQDHHPQYLGQGIQLRRTHDEIYSIDDY